MGWKDWPYWIKGGMGAFIFTWIIVFISGIIAFISKGSSFNFKIFIVFGIIGSIFMVIIGVIIGFLVGMQIKMAQKRVQKIKNRRLTFQI